MLFAKDRTLVFAAMSASFFTVLVVSGLYLWTQERSVAPATEAATFQPATLAPTTEAVNTQDLVVIGDSYSEGTEIGGTGAANWTVKVQELLTSTRPEGVAITSGARGSTGYIKKGPSGDSPNFEEQADMQVTTEAEAVIVFGSINDQGNSPQDISAAAASTLETVRTQAPDAEILVIGWPWINDDVPAEAIAANAAIEEAAQAAGATFVDPLAEEWFFGENSRLIGTDGVHPTDEGHQYMADLIAPPISEILAGQ